MPTIYLDILLGLNWLTDFLLLSATARWRHLPHRRGRLVAGAAVGAVGSLIILLPALPSLLIVLWDAVVAGLMVAATFSWNGKRSFGYTFVTLYVLSALFGGLSYLLWIFAAPRGFYVFNGAVYYEISPLTLVVTTLLSYGAVTLYDRCFRRAPPPAHTFRIEAICGDKRAAFRGLHDTGQRLTDELSGRPVLVVRKEAVETLLPPGFDAFSADCTALPHLHFRFIPFHSVGGSGLLPAFCPDRLILTDTLGNRHTADGTYIAVAPSLGRGEYDALVGDDLAALFQSERNVAP